MLGAVCESGAFFRIVDTRLGDRADVRARLGAFIWNAEYTTRSGETIDVYDDSGTDLIWGVSAGYALSEACTRSLELRRIEFDEPTRFVGLQLLWRVLRPRQGS